MKFATIRDFRTKSAAIRRNLKKDRELVLTVSGRPFAVVMPVEPDTLEDDLREFRLARARRAIERIRAQAKAQGLDKMTMEEIDALIAEVRQEKRAAK